VVEAMPGPTAAGPPVTAATSGVGSSASAVPPVVGHRPILPHRSESADPGYAIQRHPERGPKPALPGSRTGPGLAREPVMIMSEQRAPLGEPGPPAISGTMVREDTRNRMVALEIVTLPPLDPPTERASSMTTFPHRRLAVAASALSFTLALSGCAGFGNLGTEPGVTTLTLASVNNPQMQDMNRLLPEFNKLHPDIKVNIIFLEEGDLRNAITKDVATGGGQYDIMTVGMYEVPIWGENRWLVDVTDRAAKDPSYDLDDLFEPVRKGVSFEDRVYALPFYGESSFLMYRKDLFEQAGLTMPARPTWEEVARFAAQ
jgi:hypothetical protein